MRRSMARRAIAAACACGVSIGAALAQSTHNYEYDALGRLIELDNVGDDEKVQYSYDAAGNRVAVESIVPAPLFNITDASASEGVGVVFTVTRSVVINVAVSVEYETVAGSASLSDYTTKTGTLNFAINDTSKTVTVPTTQDAIYEGVETFKLVLSNPSAGAAIDHEEAIGTINNDDSPPAFSVSDASASEGDNITFVVTASNPSVFSHSVNYATANNTALSSSDYVAASGMLTYSPGQTSKNVVVATTEDTTYEGASESFYLNLVSATNGATIADAQGVGTINEDDPYTVYVRDVYGQLQPGFTESSNWSSGPDKYINRTKQGSTTIYLYLSDFEGEYCHTEVTLASGYSWTGNGCEMRVD